MIIWYKPFGIRSLLCFH